MRYTTLPEYYLYLLAIPFIFSIVAIILRRKVLFILVVSAVIYLVEVCLLENVFPIYTGTAVNEYLSFDDEKLYFGYITHPFDYFPSDLLAIPLAIKIFWQSSVFGLIVGFATTLAVKTMRKIVPSIIFLFFILVCAFISVCMPTWITGAIVHVFETSDIFMTTIFYAVGYVLARVTIKLAPAITTFFDDKRPKRIRKPKDKKIRRKKVEVSDTV